MLDAPDSFRFLLHVTVLRDVKRHQKCSPLRRATYDGVRDHSACSGLQVRLPRRTEERAAMIKWLSEMLLLNAELVP